MMKCEQCGNTEDVAESKYAWVAWGRNCADFNWSRRELPQTLCYDCFTDLWELCDECGDLIEAMYFGIGYLPDPWPGDYVCPGCAHKVTDFTPKVSIHNTCPAQEADHG